MSTIFVVSLVFALLEDVMFFIVSKLKRIPNLNGISNLNGIQTQVVFKLYKGLLDPIKQLIFSRLSINQSLKTKPFSKNVQGVSFI